MFFTINDRFTIDVCRAARQTVSNIWTVRYVGDHPVANLDDDTTYANIKYAVEHLLQNPRLPFAVTACGLTVKRGVYWVDVNYDSGFAS